MKKYILLGCIPFMMLLTACTPDVGSPEWCNQMDQKVKGDWSANEAAEYAKNCIFRKQEH